MSVLKETLLLTKAGIIETYNLNAFKTKGSGSSKRSLMVAAAFVILTPYLFLYMWKLADALQPFGRLDLLLSMAVIITAFMSLMTTAYKASGFLFSFRDFDLLSSMPLKDSSVFLSKFFQLYLNNLLISLYVGGSAIITYAIRAGESAAFYVMAFGLFIFIGTVPVIIGSGLSFIVSKIASKLKKTNAAAIIGTLIMVVFVIGLQFLITSLASDVSGVPTVIDAIIKYYPVGHYYINAVLTFDLLDCAIYVCINIAPLILFIKLLAGNFKKINALLTERSAKSNYKMKSLSVSSALAALYKKELRFFISSPIYLMNTGIGMILLIIYSAAMMIFGADTIFSSMDMPGFEKIPLPASILVACFCIAMTVTTAPSISLEGKSLWILKSLPLRFKDIALSKLMLNLTVTIPAFLVSAVMLTAVLRLDFASCFIFILTGLCFSITAPLIGLLMNLLFPRLDWKSQIHAVKQSASVMLTIFINMLLIIIPAVLCVFFELDFTAFVLASDAGLILLSALLWKILSTSGKKRFEEI